MNPGDLAKRVTSGTNPEDLAERVNSGTNLGDLVEKVNSGTNPEDLAERVNSGINPGDLAEGIHTYFGTVRMTSSDSSSSVRVISSLGAGGASQSDPEASSSGSSSGPPSPVDARVLRDLEVMKADHDLDTAVTKGSLAVIRGRYSIPAEFGLHAPQPGQRPYSSDAPSMCISVDALEADLWFPLHPLIEEYLMDLGELRGMPKVSGGKAPSTRTIAREKVKVLTRRHKSRHDKRESRSHSKDKKPATLSEEPDTPVESDEGGASSVHHRPRSMKDLFKTKVHKDDVGYYTLQMSDLGHQDPDKEMKARWRGLKNSTKVWNDSSAAEEFERGLLHSQLARELYTLPSEVLLAQAAKEMVLVSSQPLSRYRKFSFCRALINYCSVQSQHFHMVLFDRVHDAGRLITFIDYRISQLQQELGTLKFGEGPEAVERSRSASEKDLSEVRSNLAEVQRLLKEARVRAWKMDNELLHAVKALENARTELPRQAVIQYKESTGFKEGLKRMGRVTYEYEYRVALARFHARHPNSEVKEDPFTIHPEDDLVPMERQQAFGDSDPPEP
ncbi:hypothetical protein B296_00006053 [Ensete ventricosum]|uniref:Uncharacterized protein n=1 Tax=Ensete ventricosum TaxID=4639 RepID=A0A427B8K5_ENSVE|nr:hypothetical protein B296_00006053 [Ensete ventricosum]